MFGSGKSQVEESAVLAALSRVVDPDLGRDIVSLGFVKELKIRGGKVSFQVELTTPACPVKDKLRSQCEEVVRSVPGVEDVAVEMTARVRRTAAPGAHLTEVRNIVAVAINLALALRETGASVGLLDADVYGPSMVMMFGLEGQPAMTAEQKFLPMKGYGVSVMSMGALLDPDRPVIWRGPMVHNLLQQFIGQVEWGALDYLVIDLPPGTGDAQLSLSQIIAISGAIIVTTPQDISILDARKGLEMFRQLKVPVLGIVENMSYFVCPHCSARTEIFRHGGGQRASQALGIPFLGEIPIDPQVVVGGDEGKPIVVAAPQSAVASAYRSLAGAVAAELSKLSEVGSPAHRPILPGPITWK